MSDTTAIKKPLIVNCIQLLWNIYKTRCVSIPMLMAACAQLVLQMPKFLCKFVIIENVRYYGNRGRSGTDRFEWHQGETEILKWWPWWEAVVVFLMPNWFWGGSLTGRRDWPWRTWTDDVMQWMWKKRDNEVKRWLSIEIIGERWHTKLLTQKANAGERL